MADLNKKAGGEGGGLFCIVNNLQIIKEHEYLPKSYIALYFEQYVTGRRHVRLSTTTKKKIYFYNSIRKLARKMGCMYT